MFLTPVILGKLLRKWVLVPTPEGVLLEKYKDLCRRCLYSMYKRFNCFFLVDYFFNSSTCGFGFDSIR